MDRPEPTLRCVGGEGGDEGELRGLGFNSYCYISMPFPPSTPHSPLVQIFFIALTNSYCAIIMPFAGWFGPLAMPIYVLCASVRSGGAGGDGREGREAAVSFHAGLRRLIWASVRAG